MVMKSGISNYSSERREITLLKRAIATGDEATALGFNQLKYPHPITLKEIINILSESDLSQCPAGILFPIEQELKGLPDKLITSLILL